VWSEKDGSVLHDVVDGQLADPKGLLAVLQDAASDDPVQQRDGLVPLKLNGTQDPVSPGRGRTVPAGPRRQPHAPGRPLRGCPRQEAPQIPTAPRVLGYSAAGKELRQAAKVGHKPSADETAEQPPVLLMIDFGEQGSQLRAGQGQFLIPGLQQSNQHQHAADGLPDGST
jgi:hypothetical protein